MTALEMFKELGFYIVSDNKEFLTYKCGYQEITFCKNYRKYSSNVRFASVRLYKAIGKQLEELGWLENEC